MILEDKMLLGMKFQQITNYLVEVGVKTSLQVPTRRMSSRQNETCVHLLLPGHTMHNMHNNINAYNAYNAYNA